MNRIAFRTFFLLALALASGLACSESTKPFEEPEINYTEISIPSGRYQNNRFFHLDLPETDVPGRTGLVDDFSIFVFEMIGPGASRPGEFMDIGVYADTSGTWSVGDLPDYFGYRWRTVEFDMMVNAEGHLIAIDLKRSRAIDSILAVRYTVVNPYGELLYDVGDRIGEPTGENGQDLFHRMKLLKGSPETDRYSFDYVLRNIYSLDVQHVYPNDFSLKIERNSIGTNLSLDESGIDFMAIFGLDVESGLDQPFADGIPDFHNPFLIDLEKGLIIFSHPFPFSAESLFYSDNVDQAGLSGFVFDHSYLNNGGRTPELYDPNYQSQLESRSNFRIVARLPVQ